MSKLIVQGGGAISLQSYSHLICFIIPSVRSTHLVSFFTIFYIIYVRIFFVFYYLFHDSFMQIVNNLFKIIMKTKISICILILLSIAFVSHSWEFNNPYSSHPVNTVKMDWIDQIIDHYNYNSNATFKQRYYVLDDYYTTNGPVYLYICGQAECRGISNTSWTAQIAQKTKGIIFALEHRFYGKSLPFGSDSFELSNLKYLSSQQGLNDLAYFIAYIKSNKLYGVSKVNPWITIGGSYAGAMSSWFRSKYPHLTVGALGSSGVVLAVEDFKDFDEQIYQSALKSGQGCVKAIVDVNKYVEDIINGDKRLQFQSIFKAQKLTAKEFLFYWADVIVFPFQYSQRVQFCNSISGKSTEDAFNAIKALALTTTPVDYGAFYLKNATFASEINNGARSWIYQSCTQFSYFQTYSSHPMRSKQLDLNFYKEWCSNIFGAGVWPFTDRVNNQFGGLNLVADNLFMTNGDQGMKFCYADPWRWASLQKDKNNIISRVITCANCGHCVDLRGPLDSDSDNLKQVRSEQLKNIQKWLGEHYNKAKILTI